jgi:hypothetical protein
MVTRAARVDDENLDDFEPEFLARGKRVYKDGRGPRVRLSMTDSVPSWAPRPRPAAVFDASGHRPGPVNVLSDAALKDARLAAMDARTQMIERLNDAYKTSRGGLGGSPITAAPPADTPDPDDDESPRDAYIRQISNAYKTPMGQAPAASADDIERARQQWLSPGAKSGCGFGDARPGISRETATQDARDARDQAYAGYLDRLTNGWRK